MYIFYIGINLLGLWAAHTAHKIKGDEFTLLLVIANGVFLFFNIVKQLLPVAWVQ